MEYGLENVLFSSFVSRTAKAGTDAAQPGINKKFKTGLPCISARNKLDAILVFGFELAC